MLTYHGSAAEWQPMRGHDCEDCPVREEWNTPLGHGNTAYHIVCQLFIQIMFIIETLSARNSLM